MKFSCVIPTFDNGATIRATIESVLAQTVQDFELFVVCDGAPSETHAIADAFAANDARIRVLKFDKGERRGEAWRHQALMQASGDAICYCSDDDCWFPDHLEVMRDLLAGADFAHTAHTSLAPDFTITVILASITDPEIRSRLREGSFNIMGPTVVGHRVDAYRRLPQGWAPSPESVPSDLHMWRKWIAAEGVRYASRPVVTTLHAARGQREAQAPDSRVNEQDFWRYAFRDPAMRDALRKFATVANGAPIRLADIALLANALRDPNLARAELERLYASATWRYSRPFRELWARLRNAAGAAG